MFNRIFYDNVIILPRKFLFVLKPSEAIWLTVLIHYKWSCDAELEWSKKPPDEWVSFPQKEAYRLTGIPHQIQSRIIKKLTEIGILNVKRSKEMGSRNLYKINYDTIIEYYSFVMSEEAKNGKA